MQSVRQVRLISENTYLTAALLITAFTVYSYTTNFNAVQSLRETGFGKSIEIICENETDSRRTRTQDL